MKIFPKNNRTGALMAILVLAIGSVSIVGVGTTHIAMASQIGKVCVFFACGNANITGGTTSSGGGGGQPTPNTAKLIITKTCPAAQACRPQGFEITISGNNPSPSTVHDDGTGTPVTLGAGAYKVTETNSAGFTVSFSGQCQQDDDNPSATGNINAGDTQNCTVINTQKPTTGTLIVSKKVVCVLNPDACKNPDSFTITVDGANASPNVFLGSATGTPVTVDSGTQYHVGEIGSPAGFTASFSGDGCGLDGKGNINAGETKNCLVTNTQTQG